MKMRKRIKSNKGITLTSLVIYIVVLFVVLAVVTRISVHFKDSIQDVADTSFETEFEKLNLYLLKESKIKGNEVQEASEDKSSITFTNGNKYSYDSETEEIYLNDTIKICQQVEECEFTTKSAENGRTMLEVIITVSDTTKTIEYVMTPQVTENSDNETNYTWNIL